MKILSPAFKDKGKIPSKYSSCDGDNVNPPLNIEGVPPGTKSLALIMDDPDVPKHVRSDGMWVHWVVFNMPVGLKTIGEGKQPTGIPGIGTNGKEAYLGPAPPDREHRYYIKLYALDCELPPKRGITKEQLLAAMEGHVLAEAQLMGRYES